MSTCTLLSEFVALGMAVVFFVCVCAEPSVMQCVAVKTKPEFTNYVSVCILSFFIDIKNKLILTESIS